MGFEEIKPVEVQLEDFFSKIMAVIGKTTKMEIATLLSKEKLTVAVAESLTAGMLCSQLATVPGSSEYLLGGIVCYHNRVKVAELNIPPGIIAKHGAASKEAAVAMAENIRKRFRSDIGLAVTGAAGPNPLPPAPVGLVYIALASEKGNEWKELRLQGTRTEIRQKAARAALGLLWLHLGGEEALGKLGE